MQSDSAMKRMRSNTILENRTYRCNGSSFMFWQVDTKSQPITLATVVMTMAFNYNNNYNKIDNKNSQFPLTSKRML